MSAGRAPGKVLVIGAGIVGLSAALRLHLEGCDVTVVDAAGPMEGCSFGNAGCLSEANLFPPATVETLLQLPRLMLSKSGPLVIRPSYLGTMLPWMARAATSLGPARHHSIVNAMGSLTLRAIDSFDQLTSASDAGALISRKGLLVACRLEATLAARSRRIPQWERSGIKVRPLNAAQMMEIAPDLRPDLHGGLLFENSGRCIDPGQLGLRYAERLRAGGVKIVLARVDALDNSGGGPLRIHARGEFLPADTVVLAAGHGSRPLLQTLRRSVPMACERGYHLMLPNSTMSSDIPVIFGEPYFGATSMAGGLRLAGTAEFAAADAPADYTRAWLLLEQARDYLVRINAEDAQPWMGTRPSMPDGMPVIGRLTSEPRVVCAFGHGHNGLTLSAITAECVYALVTGGRPPVDLTPFSLDRFHPRMGSFRHPFTSTSVNTNTKENMT